MTYVFLEYLSTNNPYVLISVSPVSELRVGFPRRFDT